MSNVKKSSAKSTSVRFHLKERILTPQEMLAYIKKDPKQASKIASDGVKIEAAPAFLDWLRATPFGDYIGNDGEVTTSALTGLEEVLIVVTVIALVSGAAVGYMKGYEDGYEDGQETTETNGDDRGDTGNGNGNGGSDPE